MEKMTSMQRVLTALGHREPDRVPFFLLLSTHGAKELGLGIREYFSRAENVVEAQFRMREKYGHDCLYPFFHAAGEFAAWGGEVFFPGDGPPTSAGPLLDELDQIESLQAPRVEDSAGLQEVLTAITLMKERARDEVPILGVVISPFSLPVMQLGFDRYFELIYEHPRLFQRLMEVNSAFCVQWANAQLAAGATAICYFDPACSPAMIPRELYLATGFQTACSVISRIKGPTAIHLASSACLGVTDDLAVTGTVAVGVGSEEELSRVKAACAGKLTVLGNLNGVAMRGWSAEEAAGKVRTALDQAAAGGGFILSDSHGEIPFQVSHEVLAAISDTVHTWGRYPLRPATVHER